ncbi:MAG TPA: hypothetical protein VJG32_10020 [Anaerolineae bacterium]|nr:hypothetical protein [Anaerolineae bacterium]
MLQAERSQPQSRKPLIIGSLNLVFAAIYLLLALNAANSMEDAVSQAPASYRSALRTTNFLDIAADGIGCVGLLIAGLLLLQKRAAGRTLTRTIARILTAAIVIIPAYIVIAFGGAAGSILIQVVFGLLLRFAYPIIAARQLAPSPAELGLT